MKTSRVENPYLEDTYRGPAHQLDAWLHPEKYQQDVVGASLLMLTVALSGILFAIFWPARARPERRAGAWFAILQATIYGGLASYYAFHSVAIGAIRDLSKHARGVIFVDNAGQFHGLSDRMASLELTPVLFWYSFFPVALISALCVGWLIVSITPAMRRAPRRQMYPVPRR